MSAVRNLSRPNRLFCYQFAVVRRRTARYFFLQCKVSDWPIAKEKFYNEACIIYLV